MRFASLLLAAAVACATPASAETWPTKPVKIVVPFTPGSATDIVARAVTERLTPALGQPVIVENRPGAGGTIGAAAVAASPPDGYTLLVHSSGHAANPALFAHLSYDTINDFAGITALANLPNVLIVAPDKGIKNVAELIALAKSRPGEINFASAGIGSATHINAEKFRARAGFEAVHVPYRGTPEALTDTMTGRIDFFFAPLVAAFPFIKEGKVLALAVGTSTRSPLLPDVPTTVESGVPDSQYDFWIGLLAPAKTPREIIDRLYHETSKALASTELRDRLTALGATPMQMTPQEFDAYVKKDVASVGELVRAAGIKAN